MRLHADELFAEQAGRTLCYSAHDAADGVEVRSTMSRIDRVDAVLWHDEWRATADRARAAGDESLAAGDTTAARGAYFRASNYYRTASVFLMNPVVDPRLVECCHLQEESFRVGALMLDRPPEAVEIPYDRISMPGYFFRADDSGMPRPTMILTDGYDGSIEELMFATGFAALERGYNVLAFDGPGQGAMIVDRAVVFRPDWENVVTPVVDRVLRYLEVDPNRIVLHGRGLGGYLAPRAATREHRLAACISDCGPYDVHDAAQDRIPSVLRAPRMAAILRRLLVGLMPRTTAGWRLRRGLWVHGLSDPLDYLSLTKRYSLRGLERLITCPTLVIAAEGDAFSSRQREFYDRLIAPKEYIWLAAAEGADHHREADTRRRHHERVFGWLDDTIGAP